MKKLFLRFAVRSEVVDMAGSFLWISLRWITKLCKPIYSLCLQKMAPGGVQTTPRAPLVVTPGIARPVRTIVRMTSTGTSTGVGVTVRPLNNDQFRILFKPLMSIWSGNQFALQTWPRGQSH